VNLLLFSAADRLDEQRICVADYRHKHLLEVLQAQVGQQLRVGELDGQTGYGQVLEISQQQVILAVTLDEAPPAKLPLRLVLALPRPKMLRRIVRSVAELGIAELHLIHSLRVEKSYWQTPVLQAPTLREYLVQGLEQSRDTVLPTVSCHRRFKPFVEDVLPDLTKDRLALLAHPGNYPPAPHELRREALLVIGPEGGFIPYEVDKLETAGCQTVSLGPRILRVENAITSLIGRLF